MSTREKEMITQTDTTYGRHMTLRKTFEPLASLHLVATTILSPTEISKAPAFGRLIESKTLLECWVFLVFLVSKVGWERIITGHAWKPIYFATFLILAYKVFKLIFCLFLMSDVVFLFLSMIYWSFHLLFECKGEAFEVSFFCSVLFGTSLLVAVA